MDRNAMYTIPSNQLLLNSFNRKCSFCKCDNHNVSHCNDPTLLNFYNYLLFLKNHTLTFHNNIMLFAIQDFEMELYNFYNESEVNKKILRSVGCRFFRIRMRSRIEIIINNIILMIFDIDISWFSNIEYNTILFNENTPIRVTFVLNQIINNYLDNNNNNNVVNIEANKNNIYKNCEINLQQISDFDIDITNNNMSIECAICYDTVKKTSFITLDCNHEYCIGCVEQLMNKNIGCCPFCRNKIQKLTCYTEEEYKKLNKNIKENNNVFTI